MDLSRARDKGGVHNGLVPRGVALGPRRQTSDQRRAALRPAHRRFLSTSFAKRVSDEPKVRRRTRLREKDAAALQEALSSSLGGISLWNERAAVESAEYLDLKVLLVDNHITGLWDKNDPDGVPFLGIRALQTYRPAARFVTVDMGAVKFVTNGADIMAPGIVEADPALQTGDWCWIRDERNKQPLAIGRALVPGTAMVRGKGKAVRNLHYVGDKLWPMDSVT